MTDAREIPIKAGGYALKDLGVTRISKKDIPETLRHFAQVSGISLSDLVLLGSTGKTESSGDIDVAVDLNKYNRFAIDWVLLPVVGIVSQNAGFGIHSYPFPIKGDPKNGLVQIDVMYTQSVDWTSFAYFSAGPNSQYKGAIRTILLAAVGATINQPGIDKFIYDDNGQLIVRVGRTFDINKGLRSILQVRLKKRNGEYQKSMTNVSVDELKYMYPELVFNEVIHTVTNPKQALFTMFNKLVHPSEVETAEQVIELIKGLPEERQKAIFEVAKQKFRSVEGKMIIPEI